VNPWATERSRKSLVSDTPLPRSRSTEPEVASGDPRDRHHDADAGRYRSRIKRQRLRAWCRGAMWMGQSAMVASCCTDQGVGSSASSRNNRRQQSSPSCERSASWLSWAMSHECRLSSSWSSASTETGDFLVTTRRAGRSRPSAAGRARVCLRQMPVRTNGEVQGAVNKRVVERSWWTVDRMHRRSAAD